MKRKICVVTGTRADYGLLYWLIKEIESDKELVLQLVATGSHLSEKYGLTKNIILEDGFKIDHEVDCHLVSDRPVDIGNSIAIGLQGMLKAFTDLKPDIVVVLGDRFEILSVAQACLILNIPLGHIHGGEATEGLIDDGIRHSVSKMAHFHFPASELYRKRIIQMGEKPEHVFNLGAPGLDNMVRLKLLSKNELEENLKIKIKPKSLLVTYHPVTLSEEISKTEILNLISALIELPDDVQLFLTMPNADTFSEVIRAKWEEFLKVRKDVHSFVNLGQLRYLSLVKQVTAVVGNSSSGIIEAPFLAKPVVDIGMRQKGRFASSDHVLRVSSDKEEIKNAIRKSMNMKNLSVSKLYGEGNSSVQIKDKLKVVELKNILMKKFYDVDFKI